MKKLTWTEDSLIGLSFRDRRYEEGCLEIDITVYGLWHKILLDKKRQNESYHELLPIGTCAMCDFWDKYTCCPTCKLGYSTDTLEGLG